MTGDAGTPGPPVRAGILAAGGIARLLTKDPLAHGHEVAAVGFRAVEPARSFAEASGVPHAHGGLHVPGA